ALVELLQAAHLQLIERGDDGADIEEGNSVRAAVFADELVALHAQPGLERARRWVEAGVADAAIPARLMLRRPGLALEHADALVRPAMDQLAGKGAADRARTNDRDVVVHGAMMVPATRPAAYSCCPLLLRCHRPGRRPRCHGSVAGAGARLLLL